MPDERLRRLNGAKNNAESLISATEQTLRDLGDKVPAATKGEIEAAISDLRSAVAAEDVDKIEAGSQVLQEKSYKLAEIVYGNQSSAPYEAPQSQPQDDVIEAEYEEVDE